MKKVMTGLLFVVAAFSASGQGCSVCTKTAEGLSDHGARGLNGGIIYLAFLPLTIIGALGFVWWKRSK